MTWKHGWLALVIAGAMATWGCAGDVCEQAADVLSECDLPAGEDPGGEPSGEAAECSGTTATAAECVVDHPDDACAFYESLADGNFVSNAYTRCADAI